MSMARKKILYVQHSSTIGGAPMSLFYLLEFVQRSYDVVVYFISEGPAVDFYRSKGIKVVVDNRLSKIPHCSAAYQSLNPLSIEFYKDMRVWGRFWIQTPRSFIAMLKILDDERPDIVHLNSSVLISEAIAVHRRRIPLIWHHREFLADGMFGFRRRIIANLMLTMATYVVVLADSEARRIGASKKVVLIPNFVDMSTFNVGHACRVGLREQFDLPSRSHLFAMLGWHMPGKGALVAVEALSTILERYPDARLVLFGSGAPPKGSGLPGDRLYQQVNRRAGECGISHAIVYAGTVVNIADYLREVDVVLVPFTVPHFARPILEAGAMRKVVVTSDLDGTREMVLNGEAGYLARPGDAGDLASRMIEALENDNRERIERMYQNVVENYNAARNAERTMALYVDLP